MESITGQSTKGINPNDNPNDNPNNNPIDFIKSSQKASRRRF